MQKLPSRQRANCLSSAIHSHKRIAPSPISHNNTVPHNYLASAEVTIIEYVNDITIIMV